MQSWVQPLPSAGALLSWETWQLLRIRLLNLWFRFGLSLYLREASFAARSDLGGYITVTCYTSPTSFSYHHNPLPRIPYEKATQEVCETSTESGIFGMIKIYSWVLNIPLYYSPLSKILPPSQALRFAAMESKTAGRSEKTQLTIGKRTLT